MADPNPAEVAIQAWVAQAATTLANAKTDVANKTAALAAATATAVAAEAEHLRALGVHTATTIAPEVGKAVAEVKADASKVYGWFLKVGVPVVLAGGGTLWAVWPKL